MRRSRLLSEDDHRTPSTLRDHVWLGHKRILWLASLGTLIASPLSLSGQTDSSPKSGQQAGPQAQICDGVKPGDDHSLSVALAKTPQADEGNGAMKQQPTSQGSVESPRQDLILPEVKSSRSVPQAEEPICKKKEKETEPPLAVPSQPLSNMPVDQWTAASGLTVSYTDGLLTINANNNRLGDVIEAIRSRVGLSIDLPPESMDDRVFDHVGPAPLRDALTQFLYGSRLNYVIQTSYDDPQNVTKLILSSQPQLASARSSQHRNQPAADLAEAPTLYGGGGFATETPAEPGPPVPVPVQPVPTASNVVGVPAGFNVRQAAAESGKTTGQILDELQKQQQQVLDAQAPPQ